MKILPLKGKLPFFLSLFLLGLLQISSANPESEKLYLEARNLSTGLGGRLDTEKADTLYRQASALGDPRALAWNYRRMVRGERGFPKDLEEAKRGFRKIESSLERMAAENLPDAKRSLAVSWGTIFPNEKGKAAFDILKNLSDEGRLDDLVSLARLYEEGIGVEKNPVEAFLLYRKSAEQGNAGAMGNLGDCYREGFGVAKDEKEAFRWYQQAAQLGNDGARRQLAFCYEFGRGVEKDLTQAFAIFLQLAEQGDAWAQNRVGWCFANGIGVPKDSGKAVAWYEKAAQKGNAVAMGNLGFCFEKGQGVTKNEKEAVRWYEKAAGLGNTWSMNQLGLCYEEGRGTDKDPKKAFEFYLQSAEAGDAWGQKTVGHCFRNGFGTAQDHVQAFGWYQKSADQGNASGMANVGLCYETGNGVAKDEKEALRWYQKAAEQGEGWAWNQIGRAYENGFGVEKDLKKAFEYYLKSAEAGNAWGQNSVGNCYYKGTGVDLDYLKAFEYFKKSADQGNASGMANVGLCCETGNGVPKDEKEALRWYQKAAELGNGWAWNQMGLCYEYGRGVEKNPKKAFECYLKSAEAGNAWGQNNVGNAYLNGQGIRQNDKQAYIWFQKAADKENWVAVANLGYCLQFGKGTSVDVKQALQKYEQAAQNGNTYAKKQLQKLANLCFWKNNYELSSQAYEISRTFGNPGAEDGLYRNHVLMRKSWSGADPRKGLTALWESLRDDPSKNAELLALAYEALDLGYPSLAQKICSQALAGICPFPSVNPALHSSFHKVRGYAVLAGVDVGPRMVKDEIPGSWPSWAVPEFTGVGYFLGNVVAGSKPLECRLRFQTDFFAPGPPRWWGILSAEILSWGLQLQAGKESGWYPRLVRTAKADSRSGIDFIWGTVQRNNLNSAKADFQKAGGEDLFSALAGRMVVASQQNDPATLRELSSQLLAKLRDVQMEKGKGGPSRKGKKAGTSLVFMESLAQVKPGALPWGNELGEFTFGMGFSQAGPGSVVFSHGMLEAAKGLFWPILSHLKPEWALWGCDLLLKSRAFLPSEAISFYELLAERPTTRAQAALRLVQLHMQFQDYSEVAQWAKTGLEGNPDSQTQAWLKAVVLWAERKAEQPEQNLPPPSAGVFPRKKTGSVSMDDPQARYLAIYVAIREAEQATARKEETLSKYEKIREDLWALKKQYPDWEPTIVQYRLKYVQKKIEELQTPR